jgi:group I intron endonuclease
MTQEVRNKISETLKGNIPWNLGVPHSEDTKEKMSQVKLGICGEDHPRFGKSHADETKEKIRQANLTWLEKHVHTWVGRTHTEKTKQKLTEAQKKKARPVIQKLNGIVIQKYQSIAEAERLTGIKDTISRCARGKQSSAGGFQWEFS